MKEKIFKNEIEEGVIEHEKGTETIDRENEQRFIKEAKKARAEKLENETIIINQDWDNGEHWYIHIKPNFFSEERFNELHEIQRGKEGSESRFSFLRLDDLTADEINKIKESAPSIVRTGKSEFGRDVDDMPKSFDGDNTNLLFFELGKKGGASFKDDFNDTKKIGGVSGDYLDPGKEESEK